MSVVSEASSSARPRRSLEREMAAAEAHVKEGRTGEAEAIYEKLRHRASGHPRLWNGLGLVAYRKGQFEAAKRYLEQAVALDDKESAFHNHLAVICRALGETDAAVGHYRKAVELRPDEPIFLGNMGHALRSLKRLGEAIDCYRRAVALAPAGSKLAIHLGSTLSEAKRWEEAIPVLREAVAASPDSAMAHLELGNAFLGLDRLEEALEAYQQAARLDPSHPGAHHNTATVLQNLGRMEESAAAYRRAIAARPDFAPSIRQLASIKSHAPNEREAAELEKLLRDEGLSEEARAELHLALATAYELSGDFDKAWDRLQAGNQILRRKLGYSSDDNTRFVDRIIDTFGADFLAKRKGWGDPSDLPVFILGMPRSGTTLVEQIICSHPQVHGAGELTRMHRLSLALPQRLKRRLPCPEVARYLDRASAEGLGRDYLDYIRRLSSDALRITDKMPFNYRVIGLIAVCLPNARIVHCVRDPLDTCISCYFAKFREALDFAYNLVDLGRYYRDYARLMAHWRETVEMRWLDMRYDDLVASPEEKSRELIAFCGLEWDPLCLEYYHNERAILTASNWQVRQPIYQSSVARWQRYDKFLGPLRLALDMPPRDAREGAAGC